MSARDQTLKYRFVKPALSLAVAVGGKLAGLFGASQPARSCQVPTIRDIVDAHTAGRRKGYFVEVGAFDGERFSNTSWLADNGWRGLYVEPSAVYARLCRLRHLLNRVEIENVAAGDETTTLPLREIGALSTLSQDAVDSYLQIEWSVRKMARKVDSAMVSVVRLDDLLDRHAVNPGFDMLVIDVGGFEEKVVSGFDISRWQPKLIVAELCDVHPDLSEIPARAEPAARVRQSILDAGYGEIFRDDINTVFLRNGS